MIEDLVHQPLSHTEPRLPMRAFDRPMSHDALFWTLQAGGWAAFGIVMLVFALAKEPLHAAVFDVVILTATGFLLTSLYRYPYRRWRRLETPLPVIAIWIAVLGTIGVPLWYEPQTLLTRLASTTHPSWVTWVPSVLSPRPSSSIRNFNKP
jgi:phosphatidylserine synthase